MIYQSWSLFKEVVTITMTSRQWVFHEGWMMGAKKGVRCYGVEVSVMAWSSIVTECQCHTLIRPRLVYDGLSRVCVRRELCWWKSEQGWWCWHVVELVVIVQKPSQTPMSFYRDVIPHHPSLTHGWYFTALCAMPHHAPFHFVGGKSNSETWTTPPAFVVSTPFTLCPFAWNIRMKNIVVGHKDVLMKSNSSLLKPWHNKTHRTFYSKGN